MININLISILQISRVCIDFFILKPCYPPNHLTARINQESCNEYPEKVKAGRIDLYEILDSQWRLKYLPVGVIKAIQTLTGRTCTVQAQSNIILNKA